MLNITEKDHILVENTSHTFNKLKSYKMFFDHNKIKLEIIKDMDIFKISKYLEIKECS